MMYDELIDLKGLNEPGIPIPYFVTKEDDTAVLLTSYSKGIPLNEIITDKNCSLDRVKELGRKAGNLLASVHTLSPLAPTDSGDFDVLFKNILSDYVNLSLYLKHEQDMISFVLNHMKEVMTARPLLIYTVISMKESYWSALQIESFSSIHAIYHLSTLSMTSKT